MTSIEERRQELQSKLDSEKNIDERRKLGQFSTPYPLADEIISYGLKLQTNSNLSFIEPAVGTGVFYSALLQELSQNKNFSLEQFYGVEIDRAYFDVAKELWLTNSFVNADFLSLEQKRTFNFLVSNPPYVRHHLISSEKKIELANKVYDELHIRTSGLMGLYGYFILLSHKWLSKNAISGWLVPSEFMDVNYGNSLKKYLLEKVRLLRIHRYSPLERKFDEALVSSCVIWFKNEQINEDYDIEFSYGGSLEKPEMFKRIKKSALMNESKWTRFPNNDIRVKIENTATLGDFFDIKRGIATGDNDFFILSKDDILKKGFRLTEEYFQPILPSPRNLKIDKINSDSKGIPYLETQYFLLNCGDDIFDNAILNYLKSGEATTGMKYICKNRKIWYQQEKRKPTHFLCSYMGRGSKENPVPFRFILNNSNAIVTNSYLMLYPKKELQDFLETDVQNIDKTWDALRHITAEDFSEEQRIYGGGLKKIEPRELAKVKCNALAKLCFA